MLRLDRGSLAAIGCAAKEKMRYALNGLYVTPEVVVATDGRRMVTVKHPPQPEDGDAENLRPRIVERAAVVSTLKGLSRKACDPEFSKTIDVDVARTNENGSIHASVPVNGTVRADVTLPEIDGHYPNFKEVVPSGDSYAVQFTLNGKYLEDLLKIVAEVNKSRGNGSSFGEKTITFKVPAPPTASENRSLNMPVRIEGARGEVVGVIMPIATE